MSNHFGKVFLSYELKLQEDQWIDDQLSSTSLNQLLCLK
jgi:hypothetical protein